MEKKRSKNKVDFLLAGGTKAATSSIHEYFYRHPGVIALSDNKHYFSQGIFGPNYRGLEQEIKSYDNYIEQTIIPDGDRKIGDFDRLTMHGPSAPELIKGVNPDAKVLFILRNPIDRAYSHYWMDVRECLESRSFLEAVKGDATKYNAGSLEYCSLIRLGYYAEQVKRFQDVLGKDRVRVWLYEDMCEDQAKVFEEMCEFIGIEYIPVSSADEIRENVAAIPRHRLGAMLLRARLGPLRGPRDLYIKLPRSFRRLIKNKFLTRRIKTPPISREARQVLVDVYKKDILELQNSLKSDLTLWLRDPDNPLAVPIEFQLQQKAKQAAFFDHATDGEFEIERPRNCGRIYESCINTKFKMAMGMLGFPIYGSRLLDVCCGSGMGGEIYAAAGARVTGLDISALSVARAVERAKRHDFEAEFVVGDAEKLPFPDRSFDIVAVHDGLHHLPDPMAAISEMIRVANRAVIVIEPARSWLTQQAVAAGLALDFEEAGNFVYRLRETDIFDKARKMDFDAFSYKQYFMYYKHEPFRWARMIERTPLFLGVPLIFGAITLVAPRLGNKICVVCERS